MPDLIPQMPVLAAFAVATLVLAITPGPDMALFISRTLAFGRAHGVVTVLGTSSGLLVHTMAVAAGLSLVVATAPSLFLILKVVGALYLLWLAIEALRHGVSLDVKRPRARAPMLRQSFFKGFWVNLTNPKIILFFLTFLPQFVATGDPNASFKLLFLGLEFVIVSLPVVLFVVLAAEKVRNLITRSVRVQRGLSWSFAGVFAAFAVAILLTRGRA